MQLTQLAEWLRYAQLLDRTRRELAAAQLERDQLADYAKRRRPVLEAQILDAAGGAKALGSNEATQTRALAAALAQLPEWSEIQAKLQRAEQALADATAAHEAATDARRAHEWAVREALVHLAHELADRRRDGEPTPALVDAVVTDTAEDLAARRAQELATAPPSNGRRALPF